MDINKKQIFVAGTIFLSYKKRDKIKTAITYGKACKDRYDLQGKEGVLEKVVDDIKSRNPELYKPTEKEA